MDTQTWTTDTQTYKHKQLKQTNKHTQQTDIIYNIYAHKDIKRRMQTDTQTYKH